MIEDTEPKKLRKQDLTRMINVAIRNQRIRQRFGHYDSIKCKETGVKKMNYTWIIAKLALEFACSVYTIENALTGSDNEIEKLKAIKIE